MKPKGVLKLGITKKIYFLTIVLLIPIKLISQHDVMEINGYKYIVMPESINKDGTIDKYGILKNIQKRFENKGFIVVPNFIDRWPNELRSFPCLGLFCHIEYYNPGFGTQIVTITLINCNNSVVYLSKGKTIGDIRTKIIADNAIEKALKEIEGLDYKFDISLNPNMAKENIEMTDETEESLRQYFTNNVLDPIEGIYKTYLSSTTSSYRLGIKKRGNQFIAVIIDSQVKDVWKAGEIKAYFEPTSVKGLYSVKWLNVNRSPFETFGKLENNGILSLEEDGQNIDQTTSTKFIKMFPTLDSSLPITKDKKASSGSGFFITANGIIATNYHVIENAKIIEVTISNDLGSFSFNAKTLLADSKNDIALLQIEDRTFLGLPNIPYGLEEGANIGDRIFTIGFPFNEVMGNNFKVTDGIISSKSGIKDDLRYYQISVPLQPGNSGGPLFNEKGNVVGITTSGLRGNVNGVNLENVNYALKSKYINNLYSTLPNSTKILPSSQLSDKILQEKVKILKNYVCLITIY